MLPKKIALANNLFVPYQNARKLVLSAMLMTFPCPIPLTTMEAELPIVFRFALEIYPLSRGDEV